jgi:hypothetical protein
MFLAFMDEVSLEILFSEDFLFLGERLVKGFGGIDGEFAGELAGNCLGFKDTKAKTSDSYNGLSFVYVTFRPTS